MNKRLILAAAVTSFALTQNPASADPLVNVSIQGRIANTSDPFTNNLSLPPSLIESGVDIQYQIVFDMAPIGTTNTSEGMTRTIQSLNLSTESFFNGSFGTDPNGDGINHLTFDLFQLPTDPIQIDFFTQPRRDSLNPDPLINHEYDGWFDFFTASAGVNTSRPGAPQFHDRLQVRPTHAPGAQSAIDPEVVTNNHHRVPIGQSGEGLPTNSFRIVPQSVETTDLAVLRARWTHDQAGVLKINGTGEPVFITGATEADPDPLVSFTPLTIGLNTSATGGAPFDGAPSIPEPASLAILLLHSLLLIRPCRR
jgi:hypothetical protein